MLLKYLTGATDLALNFRTMYTLYVLIIRQREVEDH